MTRTADPRGLSRSALQHGVSVLAVLLLPSWLALGQAFWDVAPERLPQVFALAAAYVLAAGLTDRIARWGASAAAAPVSASLVAFGLAWLVIGVLADLQFSRAASATAFLLTLLLLSLNGLAPGRFGAPAGLAILALVPVSLLWERSARPSQVARGESYVAATAYHPLRVHVHRGDMAEASARSGGGMAAANGQFVLVTASGTLYRVDPSTGGAPAVQRIDLPSPANIAEFEGSVDPAVGATFRVLDILTRRLEESWEIFVSHHQWRPEGRCIVVRVSRTRLTAELAPIESAPWEKLFETAPCLPLAGEGVTTSERIRIESGGRLAWLAQDQLLMTVGDHGFDGYLRQHPAIGTDTFGYGKVLLLDPMDGSSTVFTRGHRNPQGLFVDDAGTVWSTEHGPRGGDELNVLVRGRDYGWPRTTHGTMYGSYSWPLLDTAATGVEGPLYSWVPSVAITDVIRIQGGPFTRWEGDLLAGSLRAQTLFRIRVGEGRVEYVEPISLQVGEIRDILFHDERIWLWTDRKQLVSISVEDGQAEGVAAFADCRSCHALSDGRYRSVGPHLEGLVGRPIASVPGFEYSPALRRLGGSWTHERLDRFLTDPQAFAPGTTMQYPGIADPAVRAALIDHLEHVRLR